MRRFLLSEAGDRTRTGDPQLGKLMLYQLSYARYGRKSKSEVTLRVDPGVQQKKEGRPERGALLADPSRRGLEGC